LLLQKLKAGYQALTKKKLLVKKQFKKSMEGQPKKKEYHQVENKKFLLYLYVVSRFFKRSLNYKSLNNKHN